MDAQAYLLRHGWAGPGNPLNPSRRLGPHAGLGLSKPILVARRSGNEGVGKKTTKDPTNQWWLRGFEDALKGVGQENVGGAGGDAGRKPNALTSELYRFFVRGEGLAGSIGVKKDEDGKVEKKEKRKRGEEDDGDGDEKKASRTEEKSKKRKTDGSLDRKESKEERRRRKEEKKLKKEAKEKKKGEKAASKEEKKAKKTQKELKPEDDYPTPTSTGESSGHDESVEVRVPLKEKKNHKKDKKDKKDKSKKSVSESTTSNENATHKSKKEKKEKKEKKKSTKE